MSFYSYFEINVILFWCYLNLEAGKFKIVSDSSSKTIIVFNSQRKQKLQLEDRLDRFISQGDENGGHSIDNGRSRSCQRRLHQQEVK